VDFINSALNTPWKVTNEFFRLVGYPYVRLLFGYNRIAWGKNWRFYGVPIIQKHRQSVMRFGSNFSLRSTVRSNPLGPNHPVILCTWQAGAVLEIGEIFGMTGGTICVAENITIGNYVIIGANCTIIDTDFHPLDPRVRRRSPQEAQTAPIKIEDDVFIGMSCLILKGVTIGRGSVIGAGSVVTRDVPSGVIVAGNPAKVLR
jgi:acetyltransferase-like isoleucine patch superfamily enzyme